MQDFEGRVAVVTGGASGIGLALASRLGAEGMNVVVGDIEEAALREAETRLRDEGVDARALRCDVSRADDVDALAKATLEHFGAAHVVCNNAGVFVGGACWEAPIEDYQWVLDVNVWGVIHGIRSFVPILLQQSARGEEGHIVNTASMAGLTHIPFSGIYYMSKHAVLSLSESLYHELTLRQSKVGVSALCPEEVATGIVDGERNRPEHLRPSDPPPQPERAMVEQAIRSALESGAKPETIAERTLQGIRENRFYILAEGPWRRSSELRMEDIRLARNPTFAPPVATDTDPR